MIISKSISFTMISRLSNNVNNNNNVNSIQQQQSCLKNQFRLNLLERQKKRFFTVRKEREREEPP